MGSIGRRVLLFPMPLQGHINPMLQLASILHSRGFSITILHMELNSPNPSSFPHFTFYPIHSGLFECADILLLLTMANVKCIDPLKQALTELLAGGSGDSIACLVSDAVFHFTASICKTMNLPRFVLRTGGVSSFLAFTSFPLLLKKGYLPVQGARLEEPVEELPPLRIKDLPVIETPRPKEFYQLLEEMTRAAKSSSGIIWNSFQELEESALAKLEDDFQIPLFPIGPFHNHFVASVTSLIPEDHTSIPWLDKQAPKSVIYVSFGSLAAIDRHGFTEVAWGLANSGCPFLWVIRPGFVEGPNPFPDGFLERVKGRGHIVEWAPQGEVLAHTAVGAFWTHCGWNSTLESMCMGVPMICSPCFTDQLVNARFISSVWKVGVEVENGLDRDGIEKAIGKLMGGEEGDKIRERCLGWKKRGEGCLQPGGTSFQSLNKLVNCITLL